MADDWGDDWSSGTPNTNTTQTNDSNNTSRGRGRGKIANDESNDDWGGQQNNKTTKQNGGDDWDEGWGGGNDSSAPTKSYGNRNGGGGGGTCYNCGESGHMSRECPQPKKERTPRGPLKCYNCQQEGHTSRDCTEPKKERGGGGGGGRSCFNCGSADHMSRECPEPRKQKTCYNCNQSGHMSNDCPEPKRERKPRFDNSNKGKTDGSDDWGSGGGGGTDTKKQSNDDCDWGTDGGGGGGTDNQSSNQNSGCRKCGEEGHFARECPKAGVIECRRCKKEGHKADDCTEEVIGEDGKPKQPIYKPVVMDEDSEALYETTPTGINFNRYDKISVKVTSISSTAEIPKPIDTFDEIIKSELIKDSINRCKYTKPTPIQKYAIPIVMAKKDIMACAQTGSGKTAAFVLPILQDLLAAEDLPSLYGKATQEPVCLVISPTRELAIQIHTEAVKFAKGSIIKPCLIYGGTSVGYQLAHISRGAHFLVATPGRLLDFVTKGKISFASIKYLVLDEADRMIDQGFMPEVRRMVSHETMPDKTKRQTLMFSATFPEEVQRAAQEFLKEDYLFITVGILGSANSDVEQTFIEVDGKHKRSKLMEILENQENTDRTLIFVEKKKTADFLASYLSQNNLKTTSIHGDRFQSQRETALTDFRCGRMPVLVATSVAARGLDIKDVKHVINYDLPKEIDEYVHRIGRTGRVGNIGKATSFFDPSSDNDFPLATALIKILGDADQTVPDFLEKSALGIKGSVNGGGGYGGMDFRKDNTTVSTTTTSAAADDEGWD